MIVVTTTKARFLEAGNGLKTAKENVIVGIIRLKNYTTTIQQNHCLKWKLALNA